MVAACCRVKSAGSPEAKLRRVELKGSQGIVHVLWRNRSHCTYLSFSAIMRSQRLLRVRDGIFNHIAAFTNMNRLPRHKAYVLSAHAV